MSVRLHYAGGIFDLAAGEGDPVQVNEKLETPTDYHGANGAGSLIPLALANGAGHVFVRVHPGMSYALTDQSA